MSTFESLHAISTRLKEITAQIGNSKLSKHELEEFEVLARALYERAVILHYKAKEEKVFKTVENGKKVIPESKTNIVHSEMPKHEKAIDKKNEPISKSSSGMIAFDFTGGFDTSAQEGKSPEAKQSHDTLLSKEMPTSKATTIAENRERDVTQQPEFNQYFSFFTSLKNSALKDRMSTVKITSLKTSIGLNDKLLFIDKLYQGNADNYSREIVFLDHCNDMNDAINKLSNVASKNNWNTELKVINLFAQFVVRRYVE